MLARWSHQGYHLQHYFDLYAQAEIDLYEGNAKAAWERVAAGWPALERSLLRRRPAHLPGIGPPARPHDRRGRGRWRDSERTLAVAERDARRIEREAMPWSDPLAELIRASVAALRGDTQVAVALLASAETGFEAADEGLHAAVARIRRGELLGGAEGERLRAEAEAWMSKERIANPARLCMAFAPGRWGASTS